MIAILSEKHKQMTKHSGTTLRHFSCFAAKIAIDGIPKVFMR